MIKFKNLLISIILIVALLSCTNKSKSLDFYFVDSENRENFMLLDLSPNLLALSPGIKANFKETFKPIKKINLLALKKTETNEEQFNIEYSKVLTILKQEKYEQLSRVKDKKINIQVSYVGSDDNIHEVVFLVKDKKTGFLIGRLLGNNLKIGDIMKMVDEFPKLQNVGSQLNKLQEFIK